MEQTQLRSQRRLGNRELRLPAGANSVICDAEDRRADRIDGFSSVSLRVMSRALSNDLNAADLADVRRGEAPGPTRMQCARRSQLLTR